MSTSVIYLNYILQVPIKAIQGKIFVRISAHLYNSIDEYSKLAKAVLDLIPNCKK